MAFAARFLSRSTPQLYGGRAIVLPEQMILARSYAAVAAPPKTAPPPPPPKEVDGDTMLKNIFLDMKNKYEAAMSVLRKEKITIDPKDPAAVSRYAQVMKMVREKAGFLSESEKIKKIIETRTADIKDARTYLLTLQEIRIKNGLTDNIGAEKMMMDGLEKVEKEIKKPLMRNDEKGMALLHAEFDKINQKLGIKKEDLPKLEADLELKIAKAQLEELEKEAFEAMQTQAKREEFKGEEVPEVKTLDIRNFL